jgi:hypothetical protein
MANPRFTFESDDRPPSRRVVLDLFAMGPEQAAKNARLIASGLAPERVEAVAELVRIWAAVAPAIDRLKALGATVTGGDVGVEWDDLST